MAVSCRFNQSRLSANTNLALAIFSRVMSQNCYIAAQRLAVAAGFF
jgi:hypothetical protein